MLALVHLLTKGHLPMWSRQLSHDLNVHNG